MTLLTVDSNRRITLPEEMNVKPGQTLDLKLVGDQWVLFPVKVIPQDVFEKHLEEVGDQYSETFKRLAKE